MAGRDGDGWVDCRCGNQHWGLHGAAGLVMYRAGPHDAQVLLQHRALWVHDGGTWAVPGGARDSHEDAVAAALREANEEVGVAADQLKVGVVLTGTDHVDWRYDYVLAAASPLARVRLANAETADLRWLSVGALPEVPLHAGLAKDWAWLSEQVRAQLLGRRAM